MRTVFRGIRTALSTLFFDVRSACIRVGRRITTHPAGTFGVLAVAIGIFAVGHHASAQTDILQNLARATVGGPTAWAGFAIVLINALLYQIVDFLVQVNILITDLLISLVQFNTFVNAQPVNIGWPLVRDVVNMFFIVVLLLIAFSTIIGYDKFHYKNYLPKLLLMAVLINFSRTLVGLMIDFSQVVTLTFVNGFKQAAFGNFAKAFNYTNIVNTSEAANEVANGAGVDYVASLGKVMVTLLFAIVIMCIVATVLTIMLVYFAVRIVLLWILLIFSPAAFFALALPDKLKGALGPVSNWWKQLGSLLTGGPVVAFFLWLTLATIQGASSDPFGKLYQGATSEEEASQVQVGISKAGTAGNMATFVVAVIMLLTGLQTAVSVSKEAAPQLGAIAEKIRRSGGPAGWAARGAYRVGKTGAKLGVKAGSYGAKIALAKYGGAAGSSLIKSGQSLAQNGGTAGRLLGTAMGRAGSQLKAVDAKRKSGYEKQLEERTKHLPPEERMRMLGIEMQGGAGVFASTDRMNIAKMKYGEALASGPGMKMRQSELTASHLAEQARLGLPEDKDAAKAWAEGMAKRQAGAALDESKKSAEAYGNSALVDKIKELREKDPSYHSNFADLAKLTANSTDDHAKLFAGLKTEAWQDSGTFLAMMKAIKLVDDNGKLKDGYQEDENWKGLVKNGGNREKYMKAHAMRLESAVGQSEARAQIAAMSENAGAETIRAAEQARYSVSMQGENMYYANLAGGGVDRVPLNEVRGSYKIDNVGDLVQKLGPELQADFRNALQGAGMNQAAIDQLAKRFDRPITVEQARHVQQNAAIYANPPAQDRATIDQLELARRGQALGVPAPSSMQKQVIELALTGMQSPDIQDRVINASIISNIDAKNFEGDPAMKQAVVEALEGNVKEFSDAFKAINETGSKEQVKKMEEVIKAVAKASQEVTQKALSQDLNALEQRIAALGEAMGKDKVLRRATGRGQKKGA